MSNEKKVGILGSGSWGTALIKMISENSNELFWHVREEDQAKKIIETKRNPKYLKDLKLNISKIYISSKIEHNT